MFVYTYHSGHVAQCDGLHESILHMFRGLNTWSLVIGTVLFVGVCVCGFRECRVARGSISLETSFEG